jgi:hypothetical protein
MEMAVAWMNVLYRNLPGEIEEGYKNLNQG